MLTLIVLAPFLFCSDISIFQITFGILTSSYHLWTLISHSLTCWPRTWSRIPNNSSAWFRFRSGTTFPKRSTRFSKQYSILRALRYCANVWLEMCESTRVFICAGHEFRRSPPSAGCDWEAPNAHRDRHTITTVQNRNSTHAIATTQYRADASRFKCVQFTLAVARLQSVLCSPLGRSRVRTVVGWSRSRTDHIP